MKRLLQAIVSLLSPRQATTATRLPTSVAGPVPGPPPGRPGSSGNAGRATLHKPGPPPKHEKLLVYSPQRDGSADPGEVVWTWVPYEEDHTQGKDRPVLVVGRQGTSLVGLMLSSQSERDGQRNWFALGPGAWDREERPSWVRLDRVLTVEEHGIRREGAVLDRQRFDLIAAQLRNGYGWD